MALALAMVFLAACRPLGDVSQGPDVGRSPGPRIDFLGTSGDEGYLIQTDDRHINLVRYPNCVQELAGVREPGALYVHAVSGGYNCEDKQVVSAGQVLRLNGDEPDLVLKDPQTVPSPIDLESKQFVVRHNAVTEASPADTSIKFEGGQLKGHTPCVTFWASYSMDGSWMSVGPVEHSESKCSRADYLTTFFAQSTLALLGDVDVGFALVDGEGVGISLSLVSDGTADVGEGIGVIVVDSFTVGETPILHTEDHGPVQGQFHASTYQIGDEVRQTAPGAEFSITLDQSEVRARDGCNTTTITGHWDAGNFVIIEAASTLVGCDFLSGQTQDLSLDHGFAVADDGTGPVLTSGSLRIELVSGPVADASISAPTGDYLGQYPDVLYGLSVGGLTASVGDDGIITITGPCRSFTVDGSAIDSSGIACGDDNPSVATDRWIASILSGDGLVVHQRSDESRTFLVASDGNDSFAISR